MEYITNSFETIQVGGTAVLPLPGQRRAPQD